MCGVAFLWRRDAERHELERRMARMNALQRRRGPDAQGQRIGERYAVGHTRLRVLDLDARADQPFVAPGQDAILSYNGEIYNYRQLRAQLVALGDTLRTESDTEVLYYALRRWGTGALDRLQGMFAFVYYQPHSGELLLARDRLGIKPLCFARTVDAIAIASEAKAVLASGVVPAAIDSQAILQAFRFNHMLGKKTAFVGVETLPPGSWMRLLLPRVEGRPVRYFQPHFRRGKAKSFSHRMRALDSRFQTAVRSHLQADVPVGCYMSAGVDSCGIAYEAQQVLGERLTTYSMVFPGASYCEGEQIAEVVRALGLENRRLPVYGVSLNDYVDYIDSAESPQWWTSDLALKKLAAQVSAEGVKVVLSGEGPDELLAGYDAYRVMKLRRCLHRINPAGSAIEQLAKLTLLRRASLQALLPWLNVDMSVVQFYLERHHPHRRDELKRGYGFYPENIASWDALVMMMRHLLSEQADRTLAGAFEQERDWFRHHVAAQVPDATTLEANLYYEMAVRLPNWVLHMGDRMSAAHGLELRFPYLDDAVVAETLALPEHDRLHRLQEKYILKRMHRRRMPAQVTRKRKQPLYTPIADWLDEVLGDERAQSYWSEETFAEVGIFERKPCLQLRERVMSRAFRNDLDKMTSEWAMMMVLSTHILRERSRSWSHMEAAA